MIESPRRGGTQLSRTRLSRRRPLLTLVGAVFALALLVAGPAAAVPPGGPSANTPGTSAALSPTSLKAGDKISFRLRGFPAGETVSVKIDDGQECGQAAVHGACVVYKQRISSGSTYGSFRVPKDLKPGSHTLRFLASKVVKGGGGGTKGYTLRSPSFTIVAKQKSTSNNSNTANTTNTTSNNTTSNNTSSIAPTTTAPASSTAPSASSSPSASKKKKKAKDKAKKKAKEKKAAQAGTTTMVSGEAGVVAPAPVTAVVTGAGLSVAQAIGVGGGAVGLAALVGGLTAWWRRGGLG